MKKNTYPGKFIVIEGLDGSGQTTQVELLRDFFIKKGHKVLITKEPTPDSKAGKKIREVLDNLTSPLEKGENFHEDLQRLYAEDRKEHLQNVVTPALKEGKVVISDRYFFTSFAYGTAQKVPLERLIKMNDEFLLPDQTFILSVSPNSCVERIKKRGIKETFFEEMEHFKIASNTFQELPKKFNHVYIIKGEETVEGVFSQIKGLLQTDS